MNYDPPCLDNLTDHFEAWPQFTVFRVKWDRAGWSPYLIKVSDTHAMVLPDIEEYDDGEVAQWEGKYEKFERKS
jgi:hypothetical protein